MVDFARDAELDFEDAEIIEQPRFFMPQPPRNSGVDTEEFRARWWPAESSCSELFALRKD